MGFEALISPAADLLDLLRAKSLRLAVAESCTGGLVCAALTDVAGSSDVLERGFVTYSNAAKNELLGVDSALIERVGAVSDEVAKAMAAGALAHSHADVAAAITGVAGPGGGSAEKPVGLVHFGVCSSGQAANSTRRIFRDLGRQDVRIAAVLEVFHLITHHVEGLGGD